MTRLIFDVFPADDPSAATLGTLTGSSDGAFDRLIRVHHNDVGNGEFKVNRHSSEAALAAASRYVKAKLTGGSYLFGFFMEESGEVAVSEDEQGGEDIVWNGRGSLCYLERAILMPAKTAAGPGSVDTSGNWNWTNQSIGAILNHILSDVVAVSPSAVPLLTWDFGTVNDSAGNPWDTISDTFQLPVGMDILAVIARFQSGGVTIRMSPTFVLSAWGAPPGADVSGSVSFQKGVNISQAADRQVHASPVKSRVVVQGTTVAGTATFRTVTHPTFTSGIETQLGVRYGFAEYGATPSNTMLDRAGRQLIKKLKRQKDGPSALGVLNSPVPFTAYQPGDTVNVDVPSVFDNLDVEVAAITLRDDDSDAYETILEFEDAPFDPLEGVRTGSRSSTDDNGGLGSGGGGSGGGLGGGGGSGGGSGTGTPCCPPWDGTGTPHAGQDVLNELVWTGDGVTDSGATAYPYTAGSLRVWVAGLNVAGHWTELDPTTGDFELDFIPTTGQTVRVNYTAA